MRFMAVVITVLILLVGGIIYLGGMPGSDTQIYNDGTLVCKRWNETWSIRYTHIKCVPFK